MRPGIRRARCSAAQSVWIHRRNRAGAGRVPGRKAAAKPQLPRSLTAAGGWRSFASLPGRIFYGGYIYPEAPEFRPLSAPEGLALSYVEKNLIPGETVVY